MEASLPPRAKSDYNKYISVNILKSIGILMPLRCSYRALCCDNYFLYHISTLSPSSHLEGSSMSVGHPGNCHSPVIAVDVKRFIIPVQRNIFKAANYMRIPKYYMRIHKSYRK